MYFRYWKRGWWSWFMQIAQNLIFTALAVPLVFIFTNNEPLYYVATAVVGVVVMIPISGWLFEEFAKKSERIEREPER